MEPSTYGRIYQWLQEHQEKLFQDLKRLLRIPSVSDTESTVKPFGQPCKDVLDEYLAIAAENGFMTQNLEYYLGNIWLPEQAGAVADSIGVWSHLDVVPPGEGWHSNPFIPTEKNGYLIARGVDDNKCAAIGSLYGALCLKELGISLSHPLRLFGGTNEELGMADLDYYTNHYPTPKLSIIPDSGYPVCYGEKGSLILELISTESAEEKIISLQGGANLNTVPAHAQMTLRGFCPAFKQDKIHITQEKDRYMINATGIAGHVAFPEGSQNAIGQLTAFLLGSGCLPGANLSHLQFLHKITSTHFGEGLNIDQRDPISGPLTCVPVKIFLDENRKYHLSLAIRYPIAAKGNSIVEVITQQAATYGFTTTIVKDSAPNLYPKDCPIVKNLTRIYQQITGENRDAFTMGGGTYARKLPNAFAFGLIGGIPDITRNAEFLPGFGGPHQPDEAIKKENLLIGAAIFVTGIVEADKLLQ